jgi:hypothetical protein
VIQKVATVSKWEGITPLKCFYRGQEDQMFEMGNMEFFKIPKPPNPDRFKALTWSLLLEDNKKLVEKVKNIVMQIFFKSWKIKGYVD